MVFSNPGKDNPVYIKAVQEAARKHDQSQIRAKILKLSDLFKQAKTYDEAQQIGKWYEFFKDAGKVNSYMQLKNQIGKKGLALTGALDIPMAGVTGYDLANTGMDYAAENMGIPQTMGIMENQAQDMMNLRRRQAMLQAQQGGR